LFTRLPLCCPVFAFEPLCLLCYLKDQAMKLHNIADVITYS
jgi:hypothetical protein